MKQRKMARPKNPAKEMLNRTGADWEGLIKGLIPTEHQAKVCSVIMFDMSPHKGSKYSTTDWVYKKSYDYDYNKEYTNEELDGLLRLLGYEKDFPADVHFGMMRENFGGSYNED